MEKICYKCNLKKDIDLFSKNKKSKNGVTNLCKECAYNATKKHYSTVGKINRIKTYQKLKDLNKDKYEAVLRRNKDYRNNNKSRYLYYSCKKRAKIENLPFNIEISDIIIPEYCPILEIKLELDEKTGNLFAPSVDKIIPELGYVKDNIRVISRKANIMKLNASKEELIIFSKNIINYMK